MENAASLLVLVTALIGSYHHQKRWKKEEKKTKLEEVHFLILINQLEILGEHTGNTCSVIRVLVGLQ